MWLTCVLGSKTQTPYSPARIESGGFKLDGYEQLRRDCDCRSSTSSSFVWFNKINVVLRPGISKFMMRKQRDILSNCGYHLIVRVARLTGSFDLCCLMILSL